MCQDPAAIIEARDILKCSVFLLKQAMKLLHEFTIEGGGGETKG